MKRWKNTFYQEEPGKSPFSHSYRKCDVILEEYWNPKGGLYLAKVIDIIPTEDFKNYALGYVNVHQYYIGEKFMLRLHKKPITYTIPLWFDTRFPGQNGYEDFFEIKIRNNYVKI